MGVVRDEVFVQVRAAEQGGEVVPAADDCLAVLEAAQEGVVGQRGDQVAVLDADGPCCGGGRQARVAQTQISAAQPLGGLVTVEDGLREVDCGEFTESGYEYVRKVLRGAHDVQGAPHPLGDLAGEIQLSAGAQLGVVDVEGCDPGGTSASVLQAEGGQ